MFVMQMKNGGETRLSINFSLPKNVKLSQSTSEPIAEKISPIKKKQDKKSEIAEVFSAMITQTKENGVVPAG